MKHHTITHRLPLALIAAAATCSIFGLPNQSEAAPTKGSSNWTLYYVAEMVGKEVKGGGVGVLTTEGKKIRVQVSPRDLRKANLEGTVTGLGADGKRYVTSIVKVGLWQDLHEGWEGQGNRSNPLLTYRSVAADQSRHRYGSRIFAPVLVGYTPPGWKEPHDGFLWVADSGGGIKGKMRFDLFVGKQSTYKFVMAEEKEKGKWRVPIEIESLPSAPTAYSAKTVAGRRKTLEKLGLLKDGNAVAALTTFQKQHKHIPAAEYGSAKGAVTLWYLSQAALKVSKGEKYDATAAQKHL
jgi:3D (Asp-Asp-Asp) domain-containing protein